MPHCSYTSSGYPSLEQCSADLAGGLRIADFLSARVTQHVVAACFAEKRQYHQWTTWTFLERLAKALKTQGEASDRAAQVSARQSQL